MIDLIQGVCQVAYYMRYWLGFLIVFSVGTIAAEYVRRSIEAN